MARGNKDLAAGFSDVATKNNNKINTDISTNLSAENVSDNEFETNIKINYEDDVNVNESIKSIASSIIKKNKAAKKRQISCYIDEDIAKELDKFGKKYGKGAKSELINNFLKTFFEK